jgi:uronate dehydrogenase
MRPATRRPTRCSRSGSASATDRAMASMQRIPRLLVTGAAGGLGRVLRRRLQPVATTLRLSDIAEMAPAERHEEVVPCDLADKAAVDRLVQGCDAIVHLGGISVDVRSRRSSRPTSRACSTCTKRRGAMVCAAWCSPVPTTSSGFHEQGKLLDADAPRRPDGYYGLSKAFGEDLSRFYFDRYGIESACLRIGSSYPEPKDRRMLVTWLSYADLTSLVQACLFAPGLGHAIVYGVSANRDTWWDNAIAARIGWRPRDSSEPYRQLVESLSAPDPADAASRFQGGAFVKLGPFG